MPTGPAPAGLRAIASGMLDLVYPPRCAVCGRFGSAIVCDTCRSGFHPVPEPRCPRCCAHAPAGVCDDCRFTGPHEFAAATAFGAFTGTLRDAILRLKYGRRRALGPVLGECMAHHLAACPLPGPPPEIVAPVPLHPSRARERGFNQSELLARPVAAALGVPLAPDAMARIRRTRPQASLPSAQRALNIRGAFAVRDPGLVDGKTVLLIDDVLTSLHTVNECARSLKAAGARSVLVAAAARD